MTAEPQGRPAQKAMLELLASQLQEHADRWGFIVTIERRSIPPLAMRNTIPVIDVREAR